LAPGGRAIAKQPDIATVGSHLGAWADANGIFCDNAHMAMYHRGRLLALAMLALTACGRVPTVPSPSAPAEAADSFEAEREAMVRGQIEARGVEDPAVLRAMRSVPRHLFVPVSMTSEAYNDHPLPIGAGQTISQPYIVALMSELLEVKSDHRVLEIGTGSAYQAAVLSLLAANVYSIEIVASLGEQARERLKRLGYDNVEVRIGNGYLGWPEQAPFDGVIVTAAPEEIPQPLIDQLKSGGRLVAPVGPAGGAQELVVIEKGPSGKLRRRSVLPVRFVPMVEKPAG